MKVFKTRSSIVAMAIATILTSPTAVYANNTSELLGKNLSQSRELIATVMRGRNYVLEVDQEGKIKNVVDTGFNGDRSDNQEAITAAALAVNSPQAQQAALFENPENYQGQAAVAHLGQDLAKVAEDYGVTEDKLEEMLLTDDTVRIDDNNRIFYVDTNAEQETDLASQQSY